LKYRALGVMSYFKSPEIVHVPYFTSHGSAQVPNFTSSKTAAQNLVS
jgi:hypothetical protein